MAKADTTIGPERRARMGRRLSDGSVIYWWLEILISLLFYLVYSLARNTNKSNPTKAFRNARTIVHLEHTLGIFREAAIEGWALHVKAIVIAANYYYGSLHFAVTIAVAIVLFRKWSDDYPRWRNTLGVSTALALIGFVTFPLMPPRLLPTQYGFVDTLDKYPTFWSFDSGSIRSISNQFAAMPSVHCCWALWCACVLVPHLKHPVAKAAAVLYPTLTVAVIVITANHYFVDAVAGFATLAAGYLVAQRATRAGRNGDRARSPARA